MIEAKVYLIKSDVRTEAHCGHAIHEGEEYYMLRTGVPKWISICVECTKLLGSPNRVCMKELVDMYFDSRPSDGRGEERRVKATERKKRQSYLMERARVKMERDLKEAEWI